MKIPLLAFAAGFATFVPMVVAFFLRRALDKDLKILFALFCIGSLEVGLEFFLAFQGYHNLFLSHFYLFFEYVFFVWVIANWAEGTWAFVLRISIALFVVFWIFDHLFLETLTQAAANISLVTKVCYAGISIRMLHKISGGTQMHLTSDSRFWILAGLLIYSTGGLLFASLRGIIDKLPVEGLVVAYQIHWVVTIVINLLYAGGFLCKHLARNSGGRLELAR